MSLVYPEDGDTPEEYADFVRDTQIDLAHSTIALDADRCVAGLLMLGVRGRRGWVGDAAVLPKYQGQKLGQALMRRCSEMGARLGLRTIQLEVRVDNLNARHVYEKEGYQYTRHLPCYAATLDELGWRNLPVVPDLSVTRLPDDWPFNLTWYDSCDAAKPCWERELSTLLSQRGQQAWLAKRGGRAIAFLLAGPSRDGNALHLRHLAIIEAATADDIRALCVAAANDVHAKKLRIGLEPYDSRVAVMLREFGFALDKDLWEMVKTL